MGLMRRALGKENRGGNRGGGADSPPPGGGGGVKAAALKAGAGMAGVANKLSMAGAGAALAIGNDRAGHNLIRIAASARVQQASYQQKYRSVLEAARAGGGGQKQKI